MFVQGVLGGLRSGKSALVHRHMTGSYLPLENPDGWLESHYQLTNHHICGEQVPEQVLPTYSHHTGVFLLFPSGGRYKKEVLIDGQSHLLLIREETGPLDEQVCIWLLLRLTGRDRLWTCPPFTSPYSYDISH